MKLEKSRLSFSSAYIQHQRSFPWYKESEIYLFIHYRTSLFSKAHLKKANSIHYGAQSWSKILITHWFIMINFDIKNMKITFAKFPGSYIRTLFIKDLLASLIHSKAVNDGAIFHQSILFVSSVHADMFFMDLHFLLKSIKNGTVHNHIFC